MASYNPAKMDSLTSYSASPTIFMQMVSNRSAYFACAAVGVITPAKFVSNWRQRFLEVVYPLDRISRNTDCGLPRTVGDTA